VHAFIVFGFDVFAFHAGSPGICLCALGTESTVSRKAGDELQEMDGAMSRHSSYPLMRR